MLLATFQPYGDYYSAVDYLDDSINSALYEVPPRKPVTEKGDPHYNDLAEHLGYRPIFCFRADDPDDFWTFGMYAAPKRPERVIVFEADPDEYLGLDFLGWNMMLRTLSGFEKDMARRTGQRGFASMDFPTEFLYTPDEIEDDITKLMSSEYLVREIRRDRVVAIMDLKALFDDSIDRDDMVASLMEPFEEGTRDKPEAFNELIRKLAVSCLSATVADIRMHDRAESVCKALLEASDGGRDEGKLETYIDAYRKRMFLDKIARVWYVINVMYPRTQMGLFDVLLEMHDDPGVEKLTKYRDRLIGALFDYKEDFEDWMPARLNNCMAAECHLRQIHQAQFLALEDGRCRCGSGEDVHDCHGSADPQIIDFVRDLLRELQQSSAGTSGAEPQDG